MNQLAHSQIQETTSHRNSGQSVFASEAFPLCAGAGGEHAKADHFYFIFLQDSLFLCFFLKTVQTHFWSICFLLKAFLQYFRYAQVVQLRAAHNASRVGVPATRKGVDTSNSLRRDRDSEMSVS